MSDRAAMDRAQLAAGGRTDPFPLQGFGRDIASEFLSDPETGELDASRIPALTRIMAGDTSGLGQRAGEATGSRTSTPPREGIFPRMRNLFFGPGDQGGGAQQPQGGLQRNESGAVTGWVSPGGDFSLDSATVAGVRQAPLESHVETLLAIPDDETRQEYLEILEPELAQQVIQLYQQRGG